MVLQMFKRLFQWLKSLFQSLFGGKQTPINVRGNVQKAPAPPLTDTDLEFLFMELLTGVHQARGQAWVLKWLHNIEHRVTTERWVQWLRQFSEKLLASPTPNNDLAARLVQLGELEIGEIGDVAYNLGMQLLTRHQEEPIWEYVGPDTVSQTLPSPENSPTQENPESGENHSERGEDEYQTISLEELFVMMQQDENLRQQLAQQMAIETDDPQVIIQALINQLYAANQSTTDDTE